MPKGIRNSPLPLTRETYIVLKAFTGDHCVGEISKKLNYADTSMRPHINRLVERGLLEEAPKVKGPQNKMVHTYKITALGTSKIQDMENYILPDKTGGAKISDIDRITLAPYDAGWAYKAPAESTYLTGASIDID